MMAIISPASYTAGDQEVNDVKLTADGDWLTFSEGNPNYFIYVPGAFNPEFLKGLKVTLTGDENNHRTFITMTGTVNGTEVGALECAGPVEAPLGIGTLQCVGPYQGTVNQALVATGMLIFDPADVPPSLDGDDATNQVDIEFALLDGLRALPDATAIVPISAASVAALAVEIPAQLAAAYLVKLPDGAPPDLLNPAIMTGILTALGIIGAIAASGDVTVDVGDKDDTVDLTAYDKNASVLLGSGNDTLMMGLGDDNVQGGDGTDTFKHTLGATGTTKTIDGGPGRDILLVEGFENSDLLDLTFSGNTLTLTINGQTNTYILSNVEEIALSSGGGDDDVIITNLEQFSGGLAIDLGDGFDRVEYRSNIDTALLSDYPFAVGGGAPWPDGGFGLLSLDGVITEFANIEELNLGGSGQTVDYRAPDGGNEMHVVGTGTTTEIRVDANATIVIKNGATTLMLDGRSGNDTIFIDPAAGTSFTTIEVNGGNLVGDDQLVLNGLSTSDTMTYEPGMTAHSGSIEFNGIDIAFTAIDGVELNGNEGIDTLVAKGTMDNDYINYEPTINELGGSLEFTSPLANFSLVKFTSFEDRTVDSLGGDDFFAVASNALPGSNSQVCIVGGSAQSTVTWTCGTPSPTRYVHDSDRGDVLSLELNSAVDVVEVTPGTGVQIGVNMWLGENTLVYHAAAAADITLDLDASVIAQPGYGEVTFTGTHVQIEGADNSLTTTHTGNDDEMLTLRPSGMGSGSFRTDNPFEPTVEFSQVTQVNLDGNGALFFQGSNFPDAINVVQTTANEVDIFQKVVKGVFTLDKFNGGNPSEPYVPVHAANYRQVFVDGGRNDDLFRVEVAQTLDGDATNLLSYAISGGLGKDQLIVVDDDLGDTILRREEVDELSGFIKVGGLAPVVYDTVESAQITPFDPVTAGTGADELGREVVLESDPLEPNNNRLAAQHVHALEGVNRNPSIGDPGLSDPFGMGTSIRGDEDWYRFEATTTGTYRFQLMFEAVPTLPNGRPGLPGDGNLDMTIYDADGIFIADGLPWDVQGSPLGVEVDSDDDPISPPGVQNGPTGEIVDIGIEQRTTVYIRVRGHSPQAINEYDIMVLSPAEQAEGAIPDLRRDDDDATNNDDVAPPPGGGLRIGQDAMGGARKYIEINSFNPADGPRSIFPPEQDVRPTFAVESITVFLEDFPARAPGFQYEAIHETIARQPGNYVLVGEHSGPITIDRVTVVNDPVVLGQVATGSVTLHFDAPLPDDRFTLTIKDTLVDPARRPLDGETNALAPVSEVEFLSGNGVPGGDFIGNFTVDTRVEVGTFYAGSFWLDLNQNGIFDPDNPNPLNRDVVFQFGNNEGLIDKPVIGDWNGDGFDEVGLYALDPTAGVYNFRLDRNANGIFDPGPGASQDPPEFPLDLSAGVAGNPLAGDWNNDGVDEIGLLVTGEWLLDLDGNGQINPATEQFTTNFFGQPFAGDWDGTGVVRVASYNPHTGEFWIDMDDDKVFNDAPDGDPSDVDDVRIQFRVPGLARPLVGDFDADFDTNIGLLIANTIEASPGLIAQWLLDVGDPNANPLMSLTRPADFDAVGSPGDGRFQPAPTGHRDRPLVFQDIFHEVSDARFTPFSGNFDLPSTRINLPMMVDDMGGGGGGWRWRWRWHERQPVVQRTAASRRQRLGHRHRG